MQISITVETPLGLTWPQWKRFVHEVESLGYAGLYRGDHFSGDNDALELITSLTYLADHTERIHFSPLVAPLSVRDPVLLAHQAAAIDDLSNGRMRLGLGTGWNPWEHETWGYDLGDIATRLDRFEEGLEVITRLLHSDEPVTFEGRFFQLHRAQLRPRPQRPGGPRILIGGNGPRRTLPLVARYADVWNAQHLALDVYRATATRLDGLLSAAGRQPGEVRRTLMLVVLCGRDEAEQKQRAQALYRIMQLDNALPLAEALAQAAPSFEQFTVHVGRGLSFCPLVGTPEAIAAQLRPYAEAGVEELIIQWLDTNDFEGLRRYAEDLLPRVDF